MTRYFIPIIMDVKLNKTENTDGKIQNGDLQTLLIEM